MTRLNTHLESEGAEFLVLGQMLIQGIPAYKMYAGQSGYDLVAVWPETNRSARIQVKSRWATNAPHFLISRFDCDFVVLVRLNRGYRDSSKYSNSDGVAEPEYYVLSSKDAEGKSTTGKWQKLIWNEKKFENHKRRWDLVRDFLIDKKKVATRAKSRITQSEMKREIADD